MSIKYSDSGFLDGADETKKLSFDVSGVTTGTTRTITMPDANVDLSSVGTPDDNSVTLAKMAGGTDGNLITYDASGDPAYVTTGTSGQVLTSGGTGVAPTFQTAAGGGKVLQVVQTKDSATYTTSSTSDQQGPQTTTITLNNSSNKVLVTAMVLATAYKSGSGVRSIRLNLYRGSVASGTKITTGTSPEFYFPASIAGNATGWQTLQFLDTPGGNTTYSVGYHNNAGYNCQIIGAYGQSVTILQEIEV